MAIETYTPAADRIIHKTKVDTVSRIVGEHIHVVQYDVSLPIIAVTLYCNGNPYEIPDDVDDVKVRFGKRDGTFVYKSINGLNADRNIAYFEFDGQMSYFDGTFSAVLEITAADGTSKACTSPIVFEIDRNPIQNYMVPSTSEYPDIQRTINMTVSAEDGDEVSVEK